MSTTLRESRCEPCEGDTPSLGEDERVALLAEVPGWRIDDGKLRRRYVLPSFAAAIALVNRLAELAEREQHHPDLVVHGWNKLDVVIYTHATGGLSKNDFVLAAKIDALSA